MSARKKDRTIFREILLPLLSVLIFQMLFMVSVIIVGGVIDRLNQNATDILAQQTENRSAYLLGEMIGNWSDLEMLSNEIDAKVEERLELGEISLSGLNENSVETVTLLKDIVPDLINTMYNKKISGIFVIFNTHGLEGDHVPESMQGIYLRDLDPTATPSDAS